MCVASTANGSQQEACHPYLGEAQSAEQFSNPTCTPTATQAIERSHVDIYSSLIIKPCTRVHLRLQIVLLEKLQLAGQHFCTDAHAAYYFPVYVKPTQAQAQASAAFMPQQLSEVTEPAAQAMAARMQRTPVPIPSLPIPPLATAFVGPSETQKQQLRAIAQDRPPVVLLHGFDSSSLEFRRLYPLLEPHTETYAVDLVRAVKFIRLRLFTFVCCASLLFIHHPSGFS
jgi:hypothetical protein